MSYGKVVPVFGRTGLDASLRTFPVLSSRRLGSSFASQQQNKNTEQAYDDYAVPKTDIHADVIQQSKSHASNNNKNKISVDFEQTKEAYKSKDTGELLRSLLVFKLCSYDILVDKNKEVCAGVLCVITSFSSFIQGNAFYDIEGKKICDKLECQPIYSTGYMRAKIMINQQ